MFEESTFSGKHMILDITDIKNMNLLNSVEQIKFMFDTICEKYDYTILSKNEYEFEPHGITVLYMLAESHISIHTFPEKNYAAMDIYTCRPYTDNNVYLEMYDYIIKQFEAEKKEPVILNRGW